MQKILVTAGIATITSVAAVSGVSGLVSAQAKTDGSQADKMTATSQVSDAIKEEHASSTDSVSVDQQRQASLNQAVSQGKLTQTQADQIMAHMQALAPQHVKNANFQTMSESQRDAYMRQIVDSYNQWANSSGIPEQYLPNVQFNDAHVGNKDVVSIEEKF